MIGITETGRYAAVHILDAPYHLDRPFTYFVPPEVSEDVFCGCFVIVPFGYGNRHTLGLVTDLFAKEQLPKEIPPAKCKPIVRALSPEFYLNEEFMGLCRYLSEMTFCTLGEAAKTAIPVGIISRMHERYEYLPHERERFERRYEDVQCPEKEIMAYLEKEGGIRRDRVRAKFGPTYVPCVEAMAKNGYIKRTTELTEKEYDAYTEHVRAIIPPEDLRLLFEGNGDARARYKYRKRSDMYTELLSRLMALEGREISLEDLLYDDAVTRAAVNAFEKSGILSVRRERAYRNPYWDAAQFAPKDKNILNEEQEAARATLSALYRTGEAKAALLYGVTGSGKTRVMKAMMDEVIADGRQVIMLVPEIALTPQSVSIFCAYYGERVAVLHSGLSAGERIDAWRRIRAGLVDIAIGTRSAVFAPFENPGMIIIDEEQEHTYKSDSTPRYHARDAARYRCAKNNALLVLASATPSFESYYKAQKGIYTLVTLTSRYGGAALPEVVMADMHTEMAARGEGGGEMPLGRTLAEAITRTVSAEEQAILFINRRGYRRYLSCMSCREPVMCPHCSVPLTLHRSRDPRHGEGELLVCHHCGFQCPPPAVCPVCKGPHLKPFGYGTQRAEEELEATFPSLRCLRMDMDSTRGKFGHERIIGKFREGDADVLLGTQMVTKGHDFPEVTLVGILNADAMLYQDDYRASEKAFSLITQVIGRAGRGQKKGMAVIQTYNPEHEVLTLAAKQDYDAFYQSAIRLRESMVFPPFCDMVLFSLSSEEEAEVLQLSARLVARLRELTAPGGAYGDVQYAMFGPFEAAIYRLNERYRMRVVLKCRLVKRTRALLADILAEFAASGGSRVSVAIDVNPTNL